jgi:hypothetical protein
VSYARASELLHYDPGTGLLTWRVARGRGVRSGDVCSGTAKRYGRGLTYRAVTVDGNKHLAHRLAWLLMTGAWPAKLLDHENGNGCDNRWVNLREALPGQNQANRRPSSRTGRKGVQRLPASGKFTARIRQTSLGTFSTADEAAAAYDAAAIQLFGEFARTNAMLLRGEVAREGGQP